MPDPDTKPFVFVLMPFDEKFGALYRKGIKPACEDAGARCERVDEQIFQGNVLNQVYSQIGKADIIVSVMTERSPNVLYETGYAHALEKEVILLAAKEEEIPYNIRFFQVLIYGSQLTSLRDKLRRAIKFSIEHQKVPAQIPGESVVEPPQSWRLRAGPYIYWGLVTTLFTTFAAYLAYSIYKIVVTNNVSRADTRPALWLLGLVIVLSVLIVFAGYLVRSIAFRSFVAWVLWGTSIVSLFPVSALFYKVIVANRGTLDQVGIDQTKKRITVDEVRLFNENQIRTYPDGALYLDKLEQKTSTWFAQQDFKLPLYVIVSNYEYDRFGKSRVECDVSLFKEGLGDFVRLPSQLGESEGAWTNGRIAQHLRESDKQNYDALLTRTKGKLLFLGIMFDVDKNVLTPGQHLLRIVVKDKINNSFDERELQIDLANSDSPKHKD